MAPMISGTFAVPRSRLSGICPAVRRVALRMQPVTISLRQAPASCARHLEDGVGTPASPCREGRVLTTRTSADSGHGSLVPRFLRQASMTSESTRFLGQPSDTMPIFITEERTTPSHLSYDYGEPCPPPNALISRRFSKDACP